MKKNRLTSLIVLLVAVFTFSSCLDSDSESSWDYANYMTVVDYDYMGTPSELRPDFFPYIFTPINPEVLKLYNKEEESKGYLKRGFIVVKLVEGEDFSQKDKTRYDVKIVGIENVLNVKNMQKPELVEGSNALYQFGPKEQFWGDNGYINVAFYPTYERGKGEELDIDDFDLFLDKVSDDNKTLLLRFNHSIPQVKEPINYERLVLTSFTLPSRGQIQSEFPNLEFFGSTNDSIRVKVTALGPNERELESSEFNIKLTY
ncbi:MAG: hypothetical protein GX963_14655 [Bacteroidales bacterium]|nr:hypothetical protein [Bacteroidales bacterium]